MHPNNCQNCGKPIEGDGWKMDGDRKVHIQCPGDPEVEHSAAYGFVQIALNRCEDEKPHAEIYTVLLRALDAVEDLEAELGT
jgi:hypothetical protein